ncbi:ATP-binding protein [Eubacterium sp. BX4]|uniref:ATP-binding protein n=1 Tax=Eubacterium segne TaxID=2763045 RepID=A0ABR7F6Z8_9FIRM|nr:ATP-binding protein [Eubacterium segne]MBC5668635.1 ATP-binding protein [Eubacterium segne]
MRRFALEKLKKWKDSESRKPLIIRGARQVGKTWLMKEFGRECFENVAYVNFDSNVRMKGVFEGQIDIERIILAIEIETGVTIERENTLLIFDEIQEVPRALSSLKYFYENAPEYAIVAAGSLLGVAMHKKTSFPVGKVDFMDLYPLNFQEFLCALGEERYVDILQGKDTDMVNTFKDKYIDRLREYYYVGGMPEVVQTYVDTRNFKKVRELQKNLINYYQQDFSKHAEMNLVTRLNLVWSSIPMQLAKENKKYIYGQVREGARAKDFELAIQWLLDCGLIHKVQRINKPSLPLKAYMDLNAFKVFLLDIGLLIAMTDLDVKVILEGNKIFTEFKGALTEQYVLQQLISENGVMPYYYSATNSQGEIDFVVQGKTSVIPIEVKAEENLRAKSLKAFCDKYNPKFAVRTSMSDYRKQDWMTNIPLYNIDRIRDYLEQ